ncbi:MAG TPA: restriction endonuclease [Candidatus Elarobacter sp.]|jgi:restriction system protein
MTAWIVRAGSDGENQDLALEHGLVTIGWCETGDLTGLGKDTIRALLEKTHPEATPKLISTWTGELVSFVHAIVPGDLAVLPLKGRAAIALGRIVSPYEYRHDLLSVDAVHTRRVDWIRKDAPRSGFDRKLLNTLGSSLTVFRAERDGAAAKLEAALHGDATPAPANAVPASALGGSLEPEDVQDLERTARDAIVALVQSRFRGHDLERLVEAVLIADGFRVNRTRAGADGGVDLLAGRGAHGFDPPRICVQVKSGKSPEDVKTVRELQGALKNFGAEHGLIVSWSGYTAAVYAEARRAFFQIRLWDADDLIDALLKSYESLPAEIRADIPIKRIWAPTATELNEA